VADLATDEELQQALVRVIQREAGQMSSAEDPQSEINLRRWVEDMRRALRANPARSDDK
jgi:hypothetical protein